MNLLVSLGVLTGEGVLLSGGFRIAFVLFTAFAIIVGVVSIGYRIRNVHQVNKHAQELTEKRSHEVSIAHSDANAATPDEAGQSEVDYDEQRQKDHGQMMIEKCQWEILQGHRTLVICALTLMTVLLEGRMIRCIL